MEHRDAVPVTAANEYLLRRATIVAVVVAAGLVLLKLTAWLHTGSVALLGSLIDSLLDVAASAVNMIGVRQALVPADREHRFGHGKAEPIAALGQAAFIAGSAAFLTLEAINHVTRPRAVEGEAVGIAVMLVAIIATLALVTYQRAVIRRTGSIAITADALHYTGDVLVNTAVIVALLLTTWAGWSLADPIFAFGIAAYVFWSAARIARQALDLLMDREFPDIDRQRIRAIAMAHPEVRAVHDLRTRSSGPNTFIQFHLELDGDITLAEAHRISDAVEASVIDAFPGAEVIIHQDPAGLEEPPPVYAR
jgi:ferrous-iron efflux pump FieF